MTQEEWQQGPGLLESVWHYKWLVAAVTLVFGLGAYAWSSQQPERFESHTEILLKDPGSVRVFQEVRGMGDPARYTRNQAAVMTSSVVLQRATEHTERHISVSDLAALITVEADAEVDRIIIRVTDDSPGGAAELVDAVGLAYEQVVAEDVQQTAEQAMGELRSAQAELEARLEELEAALDNNPGDAALASEREAASRELSEISARSRQLSVDASLFGSGIEVREPASVPDGPSRPRPRRDAAMGLALGFAASTALAWQLSGRRREAARDRADRVLGVDLLGEIPVFDENGEDGEVPAATAVRSAPAEAYQYLLAALTFALREHEEAKVVLVTSTSPGDGKTVTAANLAAAAARDDRRVLLVDADGRVRRLSRMAGVGDAASLTHLANAAVPLEWGIDKWAIGGGVVVPFVGSPSHEEVSDPAAFFRSAGFAQALDRIRDSADIVIIDSSPLLAVADAFEIAEHVDAVLLVATPKTSDEQLSEAKRRLEMVGTPIIGYVLNRVSLDTSPYSYGYEASTTAAAPPRTTRRPDSEARAGDARPPQRFAARQRDKSEPVQTGGNGTQRKQTPPSETSVPPPPTGPSGSR